MNGGQRVMPPVDSLPSLLFENKKGSPARSALNPPRAPAGRGFFMTSA